MGWSESAKGRCNRHLDVKQFPGAVCSFCLSEKLSQLYAPSINSDHNKFTADLLGFGTLPLHSRSSSSDYSSASSFSPPVNPGRRGHHQRNASEVMGRPVAFLFNGASTTGNHHGLMKKSRSIAVVSKSIGNHSFGDQAVNIKSGKKKRGFWSKLIRGTGRKTKQVFKHSKSALR